MASSQTKPYGTWKSPITSALITGVLGLSEIILDGNDIYWCESRPNEGGRTVIVRHNLDNPAGQPQDVTPAPFNVRSRVHEYGGGSYTVSDGTIYFSNFIDQRLYRHKAGGTPEPITPTAPLRFADSIVDQARGRLICVREDHSNEGEIINTLVSVPLNGDNTGGTVLTSGNDFYSSPRLSPDGSYLAWLTWNHPNMPWDGTELWMAHVGSNGTLSDANRIAGNIDESICQPEWSPDGLLYFVSDRTGWWNLYRWQDERVEALYPMEAEFSEPQWQFGLSTYSIPSANELICTYTRAGTDYPARLDTTTGILTPIELPYTSIRTLRTTASQVFLIAASPIEPWSIVQLQLATDSSSVLRRASNIQVDPGYLSQPASIEFPTEHGLTAFGLFYPPRNKDFVAPENERPPLIVKSHGGPTAAASSAFNLAIQFWTSRGFAVLDVNYGGSTGYGRVYRQRLKGQFGIVDVDDCVNGARYLAAQGLVDGDRMAITGGSAGGYTTLCALTFHDTFKVGASYFGISDIETLMRDTHKFESRYGDWLIGPYPEEQATYYERSPIHFVEQISCPMIFFQGLEDHIVPPNQAEEMVAALQAKGLPVAYIAYEGEGHGFRRAENIQRSLEAELYFYSQVFGFSLADPVEPVKIENM